jgi:hypothetical protein
MSEWCLEHPWMTFFIAIAIANSFHVSIRWRRKGDE